MDFTLDFLQVFFQSLRLTSPLLIFLAALVALLGMVVGLLESWRKFDSIYWAFITATTVGYGDMRPIRPMSRVFSIMIAFTGILFTGIWVAVAIYAATTTLNHQEELDRILECIKAVK